METTEPASMDQLAAMLIEPTNLGDAEDNEIEASDDDQADVEFDDAEADDAVDYDDSDEEVEEAEDADDVDVDEYADEDAVSEALTDDYEIELKSNGQIKKATLKELKQAYAGQDYIQQGMEQNAQTRKELEQAVQQFQRDQQSFYDRIAQYEANGYPQMPQKPPKELQNSDPLGYLEQMEAYREGMAEYQGLMQERQQLERQQSQAKQRALDEYRRGQAELIKQSIPEFNDPEKGARLIREIQDIAAKEHGMPTEVMSRMTHAWEFKILHDAAMYRKMKNKTGQAMEKTKAARPVPKAGAKRTADPTVVARKKAKARARQSGNDADFAALLVNPKL